MFSKKKDVCLTEKQIKNMRQSMNAKERKQFDKTQKEYQKKQKQKQDDAFWDGLLWGSLFLDE